MLPEVMTLEYLQTADEGQYLDWKSVRIESSDIAKHIITFANAS